MVQPIIDPCAVHRLQLTDQTLKVWTAIKDFGDDFRALKVGLSGSSLFLLTFEDQSLKHEARVQAGVREGAS